MNTQTLPFQKQRINAILHDRKYQSCYNEICACERNRVFCHHDMGHFLNVARLAMIFYLKEKDTEQPDEQIEDLIYATALLHDIGRHIQYLDGTRHEIASADIASEILKRCDFNETESRLVIEAILQHRNPEVREEASLCGWIYRADKMSRSCFACPAEAMCDWKNDKKNLELNY
ncbi:MAG: HD domain-containing protein [Blautia sp.]|nr:HD domain-containing protein [Blautia sp.]